MRGTSSLPNTGLPPWRPTAASWATLFLLPLAGALVTAVNLLRMGRSDKAAFALINGLASLLFLLFVWSLGRFAGDYLSLSYVVVTIGDIGLFLYLQHEDFAEWVQKHPREQPASAWSAAAWAMLGFAAMLIIAFAWVLLMFVLTNGGTNGAPGPERLTGYLVRET